MTDKIYKTLIAAIRESYKQTELRMLEEKPPLKHFKERFDQIAKEEMEKALKAHDLQIS